MKLNEELSIPDFNKNKQKTAANRHDKKVSESVFQSLFLTIKRQGDLLALIGSTVLPSDSLTSSAMAR